MSIERVKIVTFVPLENADSVREALGNAGAGQIGEYSFCSYSVIGNANTPETVEEERIEVVCNKSDAKAVISALKAVHPYDEVAFDIYPLLNEEDL
jgi:hypothetical protein